MDMANMEKRYKHASEVKEYLGLSAEEEKVLENIISVFPMAVPSYYLSLIDPRDPDDSIRKMAIPSVRESDWDGALDTSGEAGQHGGGGLTAQVQPNGADSVHQPLRHVLPSLLPQTAGGYER